MNYHAQAICPPIPGNKLFLDKRHVVLTDDSVIVQVVQHDLVARIPYLTNSVLETGGMPPNF